MKKTVQESINKKVLEVFDKVMKQETYTGYVPYAGYQSIKGFFPVNTVIETKRLYNCSAEILKTIDGYYLKSYNTVIAFTPGYNEINYDFLRYVYGYTATFAQHIAKFERYMESIGRRQYKEV